MTKTFVQGTRLLKNSNYVKQQLLFFQNLFKNRTLKNV